MRVSIKMSNQQKIVYRLVLTGGPCGGKTTGQSRLCTFFENLGWKVFRVPETASVLLSGGVKFADLTPEEACKFQENLLKTMIQIENTFFELGRTCQRNCLIICDRGAMDASAFISKEQWEAMMASNNMNSVELRDNRYNHIVHMVSAANGAEDFYSTEDHACRSEGMELARELDYNAAAAWIGHPYFDVIDNSTDFDKKMNRLIACVCQKIGIDTGDRLNVNSKKRKFLIKTPLPSDSEFPAFQDFDVVHNYLQSDLRKAQVRLRKRGQKNHWSYIHTLRKFHPNGQSVEVRTQLSHRDYLNLLPQRDDAHFTIFKKRRCFIFNNQYYQLDMYRQPTHPRCRGLVLLETYSAAYDQDTLLASLPKFLIIEREVTGDPTFSMYNLSLKEDWKTSKRYYAGIDGNGHKLRKGHSDEKINGHAEKMNGHVEMNGHGGGKMHGYGCKMNGLGGDKINGHGCDKMNGHGGDKMNCHGGDKINGHACDKMNGHGGDKMNGHGGDKMNGHGGDKMNGHGGDKMNGHGGDKMNGHGGDKMNCHGGDKMNGHGGDKMNGHGGDKMNGHGGDKMNGHGGDKMNGHGGDKMNGHGSGKINGLIDKNEIRASKINGLVNAAKMNVMNGDTHEINNLQTGHRMDLGTPKIQKVAVKT